MRPAPVFVGKSLGGHSAGKVRDGECTVVGTLWERAPKKPNGTEYQHIKQLSGMAGDIQGRANKKSKYEKTTEPIRGGGTKTE